MAETLTDVVIEQKNCPIIPGCRYRSYLGSAGRLEQQDKDYCSNPKFEKCAQYQSFLNNPRKRGVALYDLSITGGKR